MKKITDLKKFLRYAGIFLLVTAFSSCSDDDNEFIQELPTATGDIQIFSHQTLSGNILTVPSVTVGQDSWLVAVPDEKGSSDDFIAQPVFVEKGTSLNVPLTINGSIVNYNKHDAQVVLKLYAENHMGGIRGEWDVSDKPIKTANNALVMRSIIISVDLTNYNPFRHTFDLNGDRALDPQEVSKTYPNNFDGIWDIDRNGYLDLKEFYNTTFLNTDSNWDNMISVAEWTEGRLRMFGDWAEKDFSGFDENKDGRLSRNEWHEIFKDSGFFESYDADANSSVTQTELNQGFFVVWDLNDDNKVDEAEFNAYRPYVMNWSSHGYWDY